jgi:NADH dehydrogenase [ubiquinone] 1 alpha subcomplex assembly factor 7
MTTADNLETLLKRRISLSGPMTVSDYMVEVLQHPVHGYYNRPQVLGAKGDFVTASEVSQIFGELIGLWAIDRWQSLGSPQSFALIELGPGRGTLMADFLRAGRLAPPFLDALSLHLVEASPTLRNIQSDLLSEFAPVWHNDITSLPQGPCIMVGNEFLDAMPIRQFARIDGNWQEKLIGMNDNEELGFQMSNPILQSHLTGLGANIEDLEKLDFLELSPVQISQADILAGHLKHNGGVALLIDYGFAKADGRNSLQAVKRHETHPVLTDPGTADLTAHVDFASLTRQFRHHGLSVHGPVEQGPFLSALGLEQRKQNLLENASLGQAEDIVTGANRLINKDQMGSLFKVVAVSTEAGNCPGFSEASTEEQVK